MIGIAGTPTVSHRTGIGNMLMFGAALLVVGTSVPSLRSTIGIRMFVTEPLVIIGIAGTEPFVMSRSGIGKRLMIGAVVIVGTGAPGRDWIMGGAKNTVESINLTL